MNQAIPIRIILLAVIAPALPVAMGSPPEAHDVRLSPDQSASARPADRARLIATLPPCDGTLVRIRRNVIRLTFDRPISLPEPGDVEIRRMLPDGTLGPDLGPGFEFSLPATEPNSLRIQDPRDELDIEWYRTNWYTVRNTGHWKDVEPFSFDLAQFPGDANNTGFTNYADWSATWWEVRHSTYPIDPYSPHDSNGDGELRIFDHHGVTNGIYAGLIAPKPFGSACRSRPRPVPREATGRVEFFPSIAQVCADSPDQTVRMSVSVGAIRLVPDFGAVDMVVRSDSGIEWTPDFDRIPGPWGLWNWVKPDQIGAFSFFEFGPGTVIGDLVIDTSDLALGEHRIFVDGASDGGRSSVSFGHDIELLAGEAIVRVVDDCSSQKTRAQLRD